MVAETAASPGVWFDERTELPGPAFWDVVLAAESARCARFGRPATVLFAAIAGLDGVIAQWGAEVADRELAELGAILRSGCRASDYVARLADDRFGVLLTEADEIAAINVVERLRARAERDLGARLAPARISFGWASPRGRLTLLDSVSPAEERLRHEAG
jgi:diguanylate cyclase (GGDEF)-like protein